MIEMQIRGLIKLKKILKADAEREIKALSTAMKVEGFSRMRLLKKEIRQGRPGGRRFAPLSYIARNISSRRRNNPLTRLAIGVRYRITGGKNPEFRFGWTGPKVSKRWKFLAEKLQEGFSQPVTPEMRKWLRRRLASKNISKGARKYLAIKKTTTQFNTPARPILDPFWRAYENNAFNNIRRNYRRKLAGERI